MADGERTLKMTLKVSEQAARHLQEGAQRLGLSLEAYASELIEQHLFDYDSYDWDDDPRLSRGVSAPADGATYPLDEVMAGFREELERRLATKR